MQLECIYTNVWIILIFQIKESLMYKFPLRTGSGTTGGRVFRSLCRASWFTILERMYCGIGDKDDQVILKHVVRVEEMHSRSWKAAAIYASCVRIESTK